MPHEKREDLFSIAELKKRDWTQTAITRFLPSEPDDTRPNPHYKNAGAPMKFWLKRRVRRVEKTKRFLAWKSGTEDRKDASNRAVRTREQKMCDQIEAAEITIQPGWTNEEIYKLAEATHGGNYAGKPRGEFDWSNRTAKNAIRHNLTNYEELWRLINRGKTGRDAYDILRERIDKRIDEVYPQFADDAGIVQVNWDAITKMVREEPK